MIHQMTLSAEDWQELAAIHEVVRAIGVPTFQHRTNWPRLEKMRAAGLVELGPHQDFSEDFLAVSLTQLGMFQLRSKRLEEMPSASPSSSSRE